MVGCLLLAATVCAEPRPWFVDEDALPFEALPGAQAFWGIHANAGFRVELPDDWNGDLVIYAHGFRGDRPDLFVSNPPLRQHLIANGFAWAASSYSANGFVPGLGARDSHALLRRFNGMFGRPNRVYMTGDSMGGQAAAIAIEQWPRSFDAAMPRCGVMGDKDLFDYFQDVYLTAETLIGNVPVQLPSPPDYATVGSVLARAQMGDNYPAVLNETGERFKRIIENLTGGPRPIFEQGWADNQPFAFNGGNSIFGVAATSDPAENVDTIYRWTPFSMITAEEQAFNDEIVRIEAPPQFRRQGGLAPLPGTRAETDMVSVTGDIRIPVLTLHTLGELFVPFSMQQIYARRVADQGSSTLLVQRAIRDANHCQFTNDERVRAFNDLIAWVEDGIVPAGDDVLDPDNVASDDFGCQFTEGFSILRLGLPACP